MKDKKKKSFGLLTFLSIALTYISIKILGEILPPELTEGVDLIDSKVSERISEEDKNKIKKITDWYERATSELDQRVKSTADAKLDELEKEKEKTTASKTSQGAKVSNNSPTIKNQYFPCYTFSDDTYFLMVKLAAAEEGSENKKGMAVEMSVMLNIFEGMGGKFKGLEGEEGFKKFISTNPRDGGWFESAARIAASEYGDDDNPMHRNSKNTQEMIEIAKRVAEGERYAPSFVNEHVSIGSVAYITTDGVKSYDKTNRDNYKKGETKVTQSISGGSSFTFYDFLAATSSSIKDPYGYTKDNEVGKLDAYFDFDTRNLIVNGVMVEQTQNDTIQTPNVQFDYDNKVAIIDGDKYIFDDTESNLAQQNTYQATSSMTQEYKNNITKTSIRLTDDLKYANESKIHTDSAILYTNNNSNKKNITICVNAGHGTSGGENIRTQCHPDGTPKVTGGSTEEGATTATAVASGMTFIDGTEEREATRRMSLVFRDVLLSNGYNVLMIREGDDIQLDNIARTVLANNYANCHIALHWDDTTYDKGAYYMKVPNVDSYKAMEPVAFTWEKSDALGEALIYGLRSQGVKIFEEGSVEMDLTQTSYSSVPSIDIELGDKASDISDESLNRIAGGLLAGVSKYYKENNITLPGMGEFSDISIEKDTYSFNR